MTEQKSLAEAMITTADEGSELPFSPRDVKAEMSFFLKQPPHQLPKVSVDFLLAQFAKLAKQDRQDKSLQAVLLDLAITAFKNPSGALSPRYIAIADYARSKGVKIEEIVTPSQPEAAPEAAAPIDEKIPSEPPASPVLPVAEEVRHDVAAVFTDSESPSYKNRLADIMDKEKSFDDAVRVIFPSSTSMGIETIRLMLVKGPGAEEAVKIGTTYWLVDAFEDLMARSPALKADLDNAGMPVESAARLLYARHQFEVSREQSKTSEVRGQLNTVIGISVADVRRSIEERGGVVPEGLGGPTTETQSLPDEDQEKSRVTVTPIPQTKPESKATEIATVEVDVRAVRARLATMPAMDPYVPPEAFRSEGDVSDDVSDTTQRVTIPAPEPAAIAETKPKKKAGFLKRILGGSGEEK